MLFGPLALVWYGSIIQKLYAASLGRGDSTSSFTDTTCKWVILSGLLVLSCAPHQEPRFLLPSIVPLVYLHGRKVVGTDSHPTKKKQSNLILTVWIAFNLILYIFFGWLHQGGLVSSLLHLPSSDNALPGNGVFTHHPQAIIYYKTYMPPTFLTRQGRAISEEATCKLGESVEESCLDNMQHQHEIILDLQGKDQSVLLNVVRKWLPCHGTDKPSSGVDDRFVYVVSPPAVILPLSRAMAWKNYNIEMTRYHRAHISTEDWPIYNGSVKHFWGNLTLDRYTISCL